MEVSIITPSYSLDFDRCSLLCESIEKFVVNIKSHVIVVDRSDYEQFLCLENNKTKIIVKEDILPSWLLKVPFSRKWWINLKGLPVRGWVLQQIVKLSVHEYVDSDVYIFADSDVAFIRDFDAYSVVDEDGRVRLCSLQRKPEDYSDKRKQSWHVDSADKLGMSGQSLLDRDYISQLVCWRKDVLQQLTDHLDSIHGDWKKVLCNSFDVSEYTLYGIFHDHVLQKKSLHYIDEVELCYCSWHKKIDDKKSLVNFIANVPEEYCSVLVQSNLEFSTKEYIGIFQKNYINPE